MPAQDRGERPSSFDPADFPVPEGREEEWRFTPLDRLRGLHDGSAISGGKVVVEVAAPDEVVVETVGRDDSRLGQVGKPADRVAAQAYASFETATVITVPKNTQVSEPVHLSVRGEGVEHAAFGHTLIEVEPFAQAVIVLDHTGSATYAENLEVRVGDQARLTLVCLQDWADDSVHVSAHHLQVGRDAKLVQVAVSLGGSVVRLSPVAGFAGPGGDVELMGLFFTDPGQHHEHRLFVDHSRPHCKSLVNYKGALQGQGAHSVWIGDVLIRASAIGTDTYEINRNLLLTDGPRADSVPNLEIETGEVISAGHASVTGRLDDDQLFYLMARGISETEARRLVVHGFFAELRNRIGVPVVSERLERALERELERTIEK
ncbi:MAG TPA: Fe-S cluster assembly protein SufD [Actinomycetes bacterium]|nr:Fe-S cluster assembly protein SufD [Actinomycetes bacterium]